MPAISASDRLILRELALRVRDAAHHPRMDALKKKWIAHNDFQTDDPMVLIETVGILNDEIIARGDYQCEGEAARNVERELRLRLFQALEVRDDNVADAEFRVGWVIGETGWRTTLKSRRGEDRRGAYLAHVPEPILGAPYEVSLLESAKFSVDRDATLRNLSYWENIFGDILSVRLRSGYWWTLGMTASFLRITGMEPFLILPHDDPDAFHAIMRFLCEDALTYIHFMTDEGLFCLNNGNDYIGSGAYGYTSRLPGDSFDGHVRPEHLWCLMESQESVNTSPMMFGEFIFPYQKELAELFGRCYYGCCEPVHNRFHLIEQISNLHSVSVSPWCDMDLIAEQMAGRYIFSRKPNPAWISTERFEEDLLRKDIRHMLSLTRGTPSEIIMKDVHTVYGDKSRCARWVEMTREEIARR